MKGWRYIYAYIVCQPPYARYAIRKLWKWIAIKDYAVMILWIDASRNSSRYIYIYIIVMQCALLYTLMSNDIRVDVWYRRIVCAKNSHIQPCVSPNRFAMHKIYVDTHTCVASQCARYVSRKRDVNSYYIAVVQKLRCYANIYAHFLGGRRGNWMLVEWVTHSRL